VLIPETGPPGREWIANVDAAGWLFFAGAWLIILMGYLGIVALVGFYDTLRFAGPVMILTPILGAVGLTLVTVSHLIPIAMGYELVPAYISADPAGQATLAATADTFAAVALVTTLPATSSTSAWLFRCTQSPSLPRGRCHGGSVGLACWSGACWIVGAAQPGVLVISAVSSISFIGFFVSC
jgi:hypothetical protein